MISLFTRHILSKKLSDYFLLHLSSINTNQHRIKPDLEIWGDCYIAGILKENRMNNKLKYIHNDDNGSKHFDNASLEPTNLNSTKVTKVY